MHFQNGCYLEFHYFLALGHKFLNIYDSKIEEFRKNSSQSLLQTWIETFIQEQEEEMTQEEEKDDSVICDGAPGEEDEERMGFPRSSGQ